MKSKGLILLILLAVVVFVFLGGSSKGSYPEPDTTQSSQIIITPLPTQAPISSLENVGEGVNTEFEVIMDAELIIAPEVQQDLEGAYSWYESIEKTGVR